MRYVHYGRFSTDMQNPTSIEDQLRVCRERAEREGWTFIGAYADRAMTSATHLRPGYQRVLQDARSAQFDVVVAEALDRISRDQEHLSHFYKHLTFNGVRLFTLSEGWISEILVGAGGMVGAVFMKQLSEKTHRGLRGRVEAGKSGGGLTYGYDVVRTPRPDGTFDVGDRRINEAEAAIVRRIMEAYASGMPPRKIALMLNNEGIPGPRGKGWGASTINGNAERGVGILNNPLYVGKMVWNKLKYMRDPDTGKRRSRVNDAGAVIEKEVPDLRIISDELWQRVKARQKAVSFTVKGVAKQPWDRRRPRYLLSGLAKCGCCGGGFVTISQTHMGCATARNKGMCENRLAIDRVKLEKTVVAGLRQHLMAPEIFKEFCDAYIAETNRSRMNANAERAGAEAELAKIKRRLRQIVDAIAEGVPARTLKDELLALEAREDVLKAKLEAVPEQKVLLNPGMAEVYRARVADLQAALERPETDRDAAEAIRSLVDKVLLVPVDGKLAIDLYGEIGALLKLAVGKKGRDVLGPVTEQLVMVAGARLSFCSPGLGSGFECRFPLVLSTSYRREPLPLHASGKRRGNSVSSVSVGKRKETGPLGVSDARSPAATASFKTRRAERSGRPVTRAASPRSISPRISVSVSSLPVSGFSLSDRSTRLPRRRFRVSMSNRLDMKVIWSRQTLRNQSVNSSRVRSDRLPRPSRSPCLGMSA